MQGYRTTFFGRNLLVLLTQSACVRLVHKTYYAHTIRATFWCCLYVSVAAFKFCVRNIVPPIIAHFTHHEHHFSVIAHFTHHDHEHHFSADWLQVVRARSSRVLDLKSYDVLVLFYGTQLTLSHVWSTFYRATIFGLSLLILLIQSGYVRPSHNTNMQCEYLCGVSCFLSLFIYFEMAASHGVKSRHFARKYA